MSDFIEQIKTGSIELSDKADENTIEVVFAGDLCPDRRVEALSIANDLDHLYNDAIAELHHKDLSVVNLECPVTENLDPIEKIGPNLIADPTTIKCLQKGRFDVVTLANNHILDQGGNGLMDTLRHCESAGIKTVGAGSDIKEASQFLLLTVKGVTFAILNFTESEFSIADSSMAGANPLNPVLNYHQVIEAKKRADFTFVVVHGGAERYRLPTPDFADTLRFFADLGVTAVIAHHTHCASGIELHHDVPIFYSLGNLLIDRDYDYSNWFKSFFIRISLNRHGIAKIDLIPYRQFDGGVGLSLMNGNEKEAFLAEIADLSRIIGDPDQLSDSWRRFCLKKESKYLSIACSLSKIEKKLLRFKTCRSFILSRKKLMLKLNIIRCQSHREAIIKTLQNELYRN